MGLLLHCISPLVTTINCHKFSGLKQHNWGVRTNKPTIPKPLFPTLPFATTIFGNQNVKLEEGKGQKDSVAKLR